jgi:hypothetical protein
MVKKESIDAPAGLLYAKGLYIGTAGSPSICHIRISRRMSALGVYLPRPVFDILRNPLTHVAAALKVDHG